MKNIRRILLFVVLIVPLSGCAGGHDPPEGPSEGLMDSTAHLYEDAPVDRSSGAADSQTRLTTQR